MYYAVGLVLRRYMARQLELKNHCLLCLRDLVLDYKHPTPPSKMLYERQDPGFSPVLRMCKDCLGYIRGGNWPTDVYAKLWSKELATERALAASGIPEAPAE